VVHENNLPGALKNTGPEEGGAPAKGAALSPQAQKEETSEDVAIDPAVIGTAKDYQLAVAVKRLKEMVARGGPGGRS
jgi:hypothetical protein